METSLLFGSYKTFRGVYQTFSGKHFPLISTFTPFRASYQTFSGKIMQENDVSNF
jgi:hypothetical protein